MPVFTDVAEEMDEELGEDGDGDKVELIPPPPPPFLATIPLVVLCFPFGLTVALQVVLFFMGSHSFFKIPC